jgi:hypothetical protein
VTVAHRKWLAGSHDLDCTAEAFAGVFADAVRGLSEAEINRRIFPKFYFSLEPIFLSIPVASPSLLPQLVSSPSNFLLTIMGYRAS